MSENTRIGTKWVVFVRFLPVIANCPSRHFFKIAAKQRRVHRNDETGAKEIGISKRKQALDLTPSRRGALRQIFRRINPVYRDIEIRDAVWLGGGKVPQLCVRVEGGARPAGGSGALITESTGE